MPINLESIQERRRMIQQIDASENVDRKKESFKQNEIYQDRATKYVLDYLKGQYSAQTVREMPIISTINLARRISQQQASIYKRSPEREYTDVSDEQSETLTKIYDDMFTDSQLNRSNEYFKLQKQNILQVLPSEGKLKLRVLRPDQVDVIADPMNPEKPLIYVISAMDRIQDTAHSDEHVRLSNPSGRSNTDTFRRSNRSNEAIGDDDDWQGPGHLFTVWSAEFNFIMDHNGNIVSGDDVTNPIGVLPFIDIAEDRDFEYWVRSAQSLTDFSIQYNSSLSDLSQIVRLQGFSQAVIKAPQDLLPEVLQIGVNTVLRLPIDPNNPVETDFAFVTPSSDLAGSIAFIETLLANFLSSRGLDPKTVSGKADATKFTSGVERLLSMIEKFEATRTDFSLYAQVETKLYNLVKIWHNTVKGAGILLPKYETADFPEDSEVIVQFAKPEMIQTDVEVLDIIEKKIDMGLMSKAEAIMELRGLDSEDDAKEILEKIEEEDSVAISARPFQTGQIETNPGLEGPIQPEEDTRE